MSKICEKCGAEYDDTLNVCPECGVSEQPAEEKAPPKTEETDNPADAGTASAEKKDSAVANAAAEAAKSVKNAVKLAAASVAASATEMASNKELHEKVKKFSVKKIAVCAAALIVVIVLICVACGSAYKKPVDYLFSGIEKNSGRTLKKAFPKYMAEMLEDNYDFDDLADDMYSEMKDEFGKFTISYKIKDKDKISKRDLRDLEDDIDYYYDEEVKVTAGYELKIRVTIKGKDDSDKDTINVNVYKIDGKWCITNSGLLF